MDKNETYVNTENLQLVQWYIDIISIPLCLVCGTTGNLAAFIVYIRKWSSFTIPLIFLSCLDLLFLWLDSLFSGSWAFFRQALESKRFACSVSNFIMIATLIGSTFIVTLFTIMRAYSVVRPHGFSSICTPKRVLCLASSLVIVAFAMESHMLFGFLPEFNQNETITYRAMACQQYAHYFDFYFNHWIIVEAVITLAGLGVIFIGNGVVIVKMLRNWKSSNRSLAAPEISRRLIAISIIQLLAWGPWIVLPLAAVDLVGVEENKLQLVLWELFLIPLRFQSGFGFLIYTCIGSEFRAEMKRVIGCRKNETETTPANTGSSGISN